MRVFRPAKRTTVVLLGLTLAIRLTYWYLAIEPESGRQWWFVAHQSLFDTFVVWLFAAAVVWVGLRLARRRRGYRELLSIPALALALLVFDVVAFALDAGDFPID